MVQAIADRGVDTVLLGSYNKSGTRSDQRASQNAESGRVVTSERTARRCQSLLARGRADAPLKER
jgi:hypothetical protein